MSKEKASSRDVSRCFALMANKDSSTAACRYRQGKKGKNNQKSIPPAISFDKGKTMELIHLAGTITLERGIHMEIWQTRQFQPTMSLEDVWNIPLFDDLLVFPIVFRITAPNSESLPSIGKARKMLANRLQTSGHGNIIAEEDDHDYLENSYPLDDYVDDEEDEDEDEEEEEDDMVDGDEDEEEEDEEEEEEEDEEEEEEEDEEEEDDDGEDESNNQDEDYE